MRMMKKVLMLYSESLNSLSHMAEQRSSGIFTVDYTDLLLYSPVGFDELLSITLKYIININD